ncbi:Uncharacterised protein [Vibrio cholerae]|nr:Uncharacterised protein [Vibrio cholerae]CSD12415.1 Uncharacterised protein [Vibrio cholerae]
MWCSVGREPAHPPWILPIYRLLGVNTCLSKAPVAAASPRYLAF